LLSSSTICSVSLAMVSGSSWTGVERLRIQNWLKGGASWVRVMPNNTGAGVLHSDGDAHVGQPGCKDPETIEALTGVEYLDHDLDVGVAEEPEVAAVSGERNGEPLAGNAWCGLPGGRYFEPGLIETQRRALRPTGSQVAGGCRIEGIEG